MKRLSVLLDDLAIIRSTFTEMKLDPVRFGVLAETAGASGLVCTFSGSTKGLLERDLRLIKEIRKSFFNLRIPVHNDAMRLALSLSPDMVTFVEVKSNDPRHVTAIDFGVHGTVIEEMIPNLQANNIATSVLVRPEIDYLKGVSKLPVDYVEIDVSDYTSAPDVNEEIVELDKIKSAALALGKWGMGVNCSGGIGFEDIHALAQTPNLEDITMGSEFIHRALLIGVEKTIKEALELIRFREVD